MIFDGKVLDNDINDIKTLKDMDGYEKIQLGMGWEWVWMDLRIDVRF